MRITLATRSAVRIALAWTLIAAIPACQAESSPGLDKHARKIEHSLAKLPPGTLLNIEFRNGTGSAGDLSALHATSFTINNEENNVPESHDYGDVVRFWRGKEYVGAGSSIRHLPLWVPVVAGVLAGGAVATALTVR
jgi:hypothetical protein